MKRIALLLALAFACASVQAQGIFKKLKDATPVSSIVEGKKPITTQFKDVDLAGSLPPEFGADKTYTPLHSLPKNADGAWLLAPGFYEITSLSYCLKAGTTGPAQGDAYGLAFLEGKMADIVEAILVNSQKKWRAEEGDTSKSTAAKLAGQVVSLSQKDVQLLLWAIIAKASFSDMAGRTKAVATSLLTPEQLLKLNGGAVKTITHFASDKGFMEKPEWMRRIEEAEQDMRALYTKGDASYEDFEKLAIRAGMIDEANPVERGTWFRHKDGYYVRFEPMGYPRTTIKVYVPEGTRAAFRATAMVATPSDARQRLAQTDMAEEEYRRN